MYLQLDAVCLYMRSLLINNVVCSIFVCMYEFGCILTAYTGCAKFTALHWKAIWHWVRVCSAYHAVHVQVITQLAHF